MVVEQLISQVKVAGEAQYVAAMRQVSRASQQTGSAVSRAFGMMNRSIASPLGMLAGAGAGAGILGIGGAAMEAAAEQDSLRKALEAQAGSVEKATRLWDRFEQVSKLPSLNIDNLVKGDLALEAVGMSAMGAERTMRALANTANLSGGGMDTVNGAMVAFQQILSKGVVSAEELNQQLFERMPQARRVMEQVFGAKTAEDIQRLGISAERFVQGMIEGMERLPRVSGGIQNAMDNATMATHNALARIGFGLSTIVIPALERTADWVEKAFSADSINKFFEAATRGAAGFGKFLGDALVKAMDVLARLAKMLGGIMLGIGVFRAVSGDVVGGLATAFAGAGIMGAGFWHDRNKGAHDKAARQWATDQEAGIAKWFKGMTTSKGGGTEGVPPIDQAASFFNGGAAPQANTGVQQAAWLKYLSQIAENTKPIIDWTRQAFGGGDLGRMGITPVEMRGFRTAAGANGIVINVYGSSQEVVTDAILSLKRRGVL